MFNIKHSPLHLLGFGLAVALIGATTAPASAQVIIINGGGRDYYRDSHRPSTGSIIYGSPIPAPMPVDPNTGLLPNRSTYKYYRRDRHDHIRDNVFVNPVLVNPRIRNSTIVNPRIYRDSRYHSPVREHIIIKSPW